MSLASEIPNTSGRGIRTTDAAPKANLVRNSRFWARIPNPKVARDRNRPASSRAGTKGTPALRRCDSVVAPKTTKTAWQSDTCRERPTRRERLAKTRTNPRVELAVSNRAPLRRVGSNPATATSVTSRGQGKVRPTARRPVRTAAARVRTTSWKNPFGDRTSAAKRMMNGRLLGRPFSDWWPVTSLVASAWPRPISMAPK